MDDHSNKNVRRMKIILVGDSGVGKTSLISQYVNKKFENQPNFQQPLHKDIEVQGEHIVLQIYDTGGREQQGGHSFEATFKNAKACMLVYDVHDPKSLDSLEFWYQEVISRCSRSEGLPFVVLGNKAEENCGKQVYYENKAKEWCQKKKIEHLILTSAKDNKCVIEAFKSLAELVVNSESKLPSPRQDEPPKAKPSVAQKQKQQTEDSNDCSCTVL